MQTTDFLIVENKSQVSGSTVSSILSGLGCSNLRIVSSTEEAITEIERRKPEIVLTDIQFGKRSSGIELGNLLFTKYHVPYIYTTSHSDSELLKKAIPTRPSAYLISPFRSEELLIAIELALCNFRSPEKADPADLVIKKGRTTVRLSYAKIMWVEASRNYTTIHLAGKEKKVIRISLSEFQKQLHSAAFIRIHKSYIINKKYLTEVNRGAVFLNGTKLPVGRTYLKQVIHLFK
jgi:DNA-binding LytR/AlgR family response regulator